MKKGQVITTEPFNNQQIQTVLNYKLSQFQQKQNEIMIKTLPGIMLRKGNA